MRPRLRIRWLLCPARAGFAALLALGILGAPGWSRGAGQEAPPGPDAGLARAREDFLLEAAGRPASRRNNARRSRRAAAPGAARTRAGDCRAAARAGSDAGADVLRWPYRRCPGPRPCRCRPAPGVVRAARRGEQ